MSLIIVAGKAPHHHHRHHLLKAKGPKATDIAVKIHAAELERYQPMISVSRATQTRFRIQLNLV